MTKAIESHNDCNGGIIDISDTAKAEHRTSWLRHGRWYESTALDNEGSLYCPGQRRGCCDCCGLWDLLVGWASAIKPSRKAISTSSHGIEAYVSQGVPER